MDLGSLNGVWAFDVQFCQPWSREKEGIDATILNLRAQGKCLFLPLLLSVVGLSRVRVNILILSINGPLRWIKISRWNVQSCWDKKHSLSPLEQTSMRSRWTDKIANYKITSHEPKRNFILWASIICLNGADSDIVPEMYRLNESILETLVPRWFEEVHHSSTRYDPRKSNQLRNRRAPSTINKLMRWAHHNLRIRRHKREAQRQTLVQSTDNTVWSLSSALL